MWLLNRSVLLKSLWRNGQFLLQSGLYNLCDNISQTLTSFCHNGGSSGNILLGKSHPSTVSLLLHWSFSKFPFFAFQKGKNNFEIGGHEKLISKTVATNRNKKDQISTSLLKRLKANLPKNRKKQTIGKSEPFIFDLGNHDWLLHPSTTN